MSASGQVIELGFLHGVLGLPASASDEDVLAAVAELKERAGKIEGRQETESGEQFFSA